MTVPRVSTLMPLIAACALSLLGVAAEHPMESVIGLLQKLGEQVETEGRAEEVTYTKFEYWCANSRRSLSAAITEGKAKMDALESEIDSHTKNIEVLAEGIAAHEQELLDLDASDSKSDGQRTAGANLYTEESAALTATIKAIDEAIKALVDAKGTTAGFLLAQQRARIVNALAGGRATKEQREALEGFATMQDPRPDLKAKGDAAGHVKKYSFKSDSIVDLLKELRLKFQDDLTGTNAAETNAVNAHSLEKGAREQLRTAATAAKDAKVSSKASAEEALTLAQGDYTNTKSDVEADSSTLEETEKACDVKKSEWAERSTTRQKEKEAIETAVKILAKVSGVRTEAATNPVLPPSPVAAETGSGGFIQRGIHGRSPAALRALTLLRAEATADHSTALARLADALAAQEEGPFDLVINAIQKMIFREMSDQTEEDEHKAWCDLELNKTNASIQDKQAKMDELDLKITAYKATVVELLREVGEADDMVTTINTHMEEATEIRKIGKEQNKLAKKDAQDAQVALANAIAVLKDFYKSSGQMPKESWEFLQHRVNARAHAPVELPDTPSTWEAGYTGVADPAKQPDGIVAILEKVSADFARMASQTDAQEFSDQEAYDEDMKRCSIEKARRAKESEMKEQERQRLLEKVATLEETHKNVKGEREATEQYWKDLQPACVEGDSTYEDRKAARNTTIQALKQAQAILQSDNATAAATAPADPPSLIAKSFLQIRGARRQ